MLHQGSRLHAAGRAALHCGFAICERLFGPPAKIHPAMSGRYRDAVAGLREALNEPGRREEAAEIIRSLIDTIVLRPHADGDRKTLTIDLTGHLAGILNLANAEARRPGPEDRQIKLVAGTGFEPVTFRL